MLNLPPLLIAGCLRSLLTTDLGMSNEHRRSPALSDPTYDQSFSPLTDSQLDAALAVERQFREVDEAERGQLLEASGTAYFANFGTSHPQLYLPEQVGGGRGRARSASPSRITPTKLRPKINATEKGQRLILLGRAETHRAELEPLPSDHPPPLSDSTIPSSSTDSTLSISNSSFMYDMSYGMVPHSGQFNDAYMGTLGNPGYLHPADPARHHSVDGGFRQQHQPSSNVVDNAAYLHQDNLYPRHPHHRQERRRSPYPDDASYPHSHAHPHQERRRSPYPTQDVMEPLPKAQPAAQPAQPLLGPGAHKSLFPPGPDLETVLDQAGFQDLVPPPRPASKAPVKSNGPKINILPPTPAAPTPAPCSDVFSAPASIHQAFALSLNLDHLEVGDLGDSPTIGRLSQEKQDVVQNCFKQMDNVLKKASEATGLSHTQLFNRYQQTLSGTRLSSKWNIYQSYIRQNLEQELSRLPQEFRPDGMHSKFFVHALFE